MDPPNLGLGPLGCVELFWGWGLLFGISLSLPSSWRIEQCVVDTLRPKVASRVIFLWENRAHVAVKSYFPLGQSCRFSRSLHWVRLGLWLCICRPAKTKFLELLIWQWSCRPRVPLGDLAAHLPFRFSSFVFKLWLIFLFPTSTCPLAWGRATDEKTFLNWRSLQNSLNSSQSNFVPLSDTMV